jgi:hypothetical protein
MSLFIRLADFVFFFFCFIDLAEAAAGRLPPRPYNLLINVCADSNTCFDTISLALTLGDVFSAMSVRILRPVRNVSL